MKRFSVLIAAALLAAAAIASVTVTEQPTVYMILLPDDSIEKGKVWPKSEDECLARAKAIAGSCSIRRKFVATTTCTDEKAPVVQLEQKEQDGGKYWVIPTGLLEPPAPSEANGWATMVWVYVRNPAWPGGYPNCWVRGWAPEDTWRVNPNYPGTPIMELIVPGMADISEGPPDTSYTCWSGDPECVPPVPPA